MCIGRSSLSTHSFWSLSETLKCHWAGTSCASKIPSAAAGCVTCGTRLWCQCLMCCSTRRRLECQAAAVADVNDLQQWHAGQDSLEHRPVSVECDEAQRLQPGTAGETLQRLSSGGATQEPQPRQLLQRTQLSQLSAAAGIITGHAAQCRSRKPSSAGVIA